MSHVLLLVLFAVSFAWYMINIVRWHRVAYDPQADKHPFNFKPLNCVPCLSLWVGLVAGLICGAGWAAIAVAFIAGTLGAIVNAAAKKLL